MKGKVFAVRSFETGRGPVTLVLAENSQGYVWLKRVSSFAHRQDLYRWRNRPVHLSSWYAMSGTRLGELVRGLKAKKEFLSLEPLARLILVYKSGKWKSGCVDLTGVVKWLLDNVEA